MKLTNISGYLPPTGSEMDKRSFKYLVNVSLSNKKEEILLTINRMNGSIYSIQVQDRVIFVTEKNATTTNMAGTNFTRLKMELSIPAVASDKQMT